MRNARALSLAAVLLGASSASAEPSKANPAHVIDTPCKGCRASLPPGADPVPLLVVLHGDYGHGPPEVLATWERHAASRGVAVLALSCPRDLGCKGSWWQWDGDPAWVTAQVDALAAKRPIDRARVWLAGWSGGASYMGMRAQAFQRTFAALVFQGGGIPPSTTGCAATPEADTATGAAPVYFLVGSGNPLHHLAVRLRQHHERCHDEVVWKLLPGADHPAEWRALDANGGAIMDWLLKQRRREATVLTRAAPSDG